MTIWLKKSSFNVSDNKTKKKVKKVPEDHVLPIEPYPVTFRTNTPSPTELETAGSYIHH